MVTASPLIPTVTTTNGPQFSRMVEMVQELVSLINLIKTITTFPFPQNLDAVSFELQLENSYLVTCEPKEDSEQPAHSDSLIRKGKKKNSSLSLCKTFTALAIQNVPNEDSDQPRLICIFAGRTCLKVCFLTLRLCCVFFACVSRTLLFLAICKSGPDLNYCHSTVGINKLFESRGLV